MRRIVVGAKARAELLEVITWAKEHRDAGYAEKFAKAMSAAFYEIAERPMMWPARKGEPDTRSRHLRALRYTVSYRVDATTIKITAIRHMRRRPLSPKSRR